MACALHRLRCYEAAWRRLRFASDQGMHAMVDAGDVARYNRALAVLRQAGVAIGPRYDVTGPVFPGGTFPNQRHDGVPLHLLLGKVRTVLVLHDATRPDALPAATTENGALDRASS